MKRYAVRFEPEARADFDSIYGWIAEQGGLAVADGFAERLRIFCLSLDRMPMRGTPRDEVMAGLRTLTFERAVQIAYLIGEAQVDILRLAYRGRLLEPMLAGPQPPRSSE